VDSLNVPGRCIQGLSELSEVTTANWIFDVEIEKLRGNFFERSGEKKFLSPASTNRALESTILKHHFQIFRIDFYDFLLA
jgi:hypothetical protein